MRKILIPLLALVMMGLSSCNLNREDNYTFSYNVVFSVLDENKEGVETYFQNFIRQHDGRSFYGAYNEALTKGTEDFLKDQEDLDMEFIATLLTAEDEAIQLRYFMEAPSVSVIVGLVNWTAKDPQQQ